MNHRFIEAASPVDGVDMLYNGKTTNFVTVKYQLYDKLQADHGDLATFIETDERWYLEAPTMEDLDEKFPEELSTGSKESMFTR